jgi:hypothetical protein
MGWASPVRVPVPRVTAYSKGGRGLIRFAIKDVKNVLASTKGKGSELPPNGMRGQKELGTQGSLRPRIENI